MATSRKGARKTVRVSTKSRSTAGSASQLNSQPVSRIKAADVHLDYLRRAAKFSEARNKDTIHRRKKIPKVKKGRLVKDLQPNAPLAFEADVPRTALRSLRATPMVPTDTVTLMTNVQLPDVAAAETASHVCEPSAAINGKVIFYTGNWFAAISTNGGTTFKYIDPYTTFPDPPGMKFCCDQVVHYLPGIDTFVWLLQYTTDSNSENIQRLAYATTEKVKSGNWKYFDINPKSLGLGPGIWLDFPDLADGKNMLYLTTNCFDANDDWTHSVVVRIRLSSFTTNRLSAASFTSRALFNFRVAQNCGTTAYFASHKSTSALTIFSWKETSATPTSKDISVASWADNNYSSLTPDGHNWLNRADRRITGATLAGNELWVGWGAARGGANRRPHPYVQLARINVTNMTLIDNVNLWDPNSAMCYVALSTNANNEVGAAFSLGGGPKFPTGVVGILTGTQRQVTTFASVRGPAENKWGDYAAVRRIYPNQKLFLATGYSLQSGSGLSDATPHVTVFGRSLDVAPRR